MEREEEGGLEEEGRRAAAWATGSEVFVGDATVEGPTPTLNSARSWHILSPLLGYRKVLI